jgi:hypothetical protein
MSPRTQLLITVLGGILGGIIVAVTNWFLSNRSTRRTREVDWLQEQLRLLYGPLFFFTSQNEELFKLTDT